MRPSRSGSRQARSCFLARGASRLARTDHSEYPISSRISDRRFAMQVLQPSQRNQAMVTYRIALGPEFDTAPDDTEETLVGGPARQDAIGAATTGLRANLVNEQARELAARDRQLAAREAEL